MINTSYDPFVYFRVKNVFAVNVVYHLQPSRGHNTFITHYWPYQDVSLLGISGMTLRV